MTVRDRLIQFAKLKERSVRAFESKVGLTNGYINAIRVSIGPDKIDSIVSNYPDLNVEWLLTGEGEMLKDARSESEPYFTSKCGTKYYELPFGKFRMRVPLVPIEAYAKYIDEYRDAELLEDYSEVDFIVDKVGLGKYLAFEIKGDSMDDDSKRSIPDGSIVLGRNVSMDYWKDNLRIKDFPYWIIVMANTILCKEIVEHDIEKGTIVCHSLNDSPEYEDFEVNLRDVRQLFNIVKKQFM